MTMVKMRIFGIVVDAFRTSSLMWMAPSKPTKQYTTVNNPTHHDVPFEYPPPYVPLSFNEEAQTKSEVLRGARVTRGTRRATKKAT